MNGTDQPSLRSSAAGHENADDSAHPTFASGQLLLGRYIVERLIARGGMGEVYEARHVQLGKRVALKTLLPQYDSAAGRRRFEREARLLAALDNEHIVSAFDFGSCDDGRPVLVMEYLVGTTLRAVLQEEGTLVAPRAVRLALQICEGLVAAHAAGAVHRDLKPENVFVCRKPDHREVCKILDFGLVKLRDDLSAPKTRTGIALGTLRYMSPEQALGNKAVDQRADIYSVCAVLYEALAGVRPHEADTEFALMQRIINEQPHPLHELCGVPIGLSKVVHRGLLTDASERPQSVGELIAALRGYAEPAGTAMQAQSTTALPAPKTSRRRVWLKAGWLLLPTSALAMFVIQTPAVVAPPGLPSIVSSEPQPSPKRELPAEPSGDPLPQREPNPSPNGQAQAAPAGKEPGSSRKSRSPGVAGAAPASSTSATAPTPAGSDDLSFDRRNPYRQAD